MESALSALFTSGMSCVMVWRALHSKSRLAALPVAAAANSTSHTRTSFWDTSTTRAGYVPGPAGVSARLSPLGVASSAAAAVAGGWAPGAGLAVPPPSPASGRFGGCFGITLLSSIVGTEETYCESTCTEYSCGFGVACPFTSSAWSLFLALGCFSRNTRFAVSSAALLYGSTSSFVVTDLTSPWNLVADAEGAGSSVSPRTS
mmetsp:Transcript_12433/g.43149  ORF Transcript_12433/g.43149 Transcript_12433/m.43149 type:complete len:203 (-) Transcript_12433:2687-3295(-)